MRAASTDRMRRFDFRLAEFSLGFFSICSGSLSLRLWLRMVFSMGLRDAHFIVRSGVDEEHSLIHREKQASPSAFVGYFCPREVAPRVS